MNPPLRSQEINSHQDYEELRQQSKASTNILIFESGTTQLGMDLNFFIRFYGTLIF